MIRRVALLAAAVGGSCGRGPVAAATLPPAAPPVPASFVPGPRYFVGEVCYSVALRADHYYPLFAGGDIAWTADDAAARTPLTAKPWRFTVLGFDGAVHGQMVTAPERTPSDPRGIAGDYSGLWSVGPCSYRLPDGKRGSWADCGAAGNCGIALAVDEEPPTPPQDASTEPVKLCVADGTLIGDLDGDGAAEAFPLEGFRALAAVDGTPAAGPSCAEPRFAWFRMPVGPDMIDVLGAVDLDHDGQMELLVAHTAAGGPRTVTLYAPAPGRPPRLERRASVVR
jgi:hypothetical protein